MYFNSSRKHSEAVFRILSLQIEISIYQWFISTWIRLAFLPKNQESLLYSIFLRLTWLYDLRTTLSSKTIITSVQQSKWPISILSKDLNNHKQHQLSYIHLDDAKQVLKMSGLVNNYLVSRHIPNPHRTDVLRKTG